MHLIHLRLLALYEVIYVSREKSVYTADLSTVKHLPEGNWS